MITILENKGYSYKLSGGTVAVTHNGDVYLSRLTTPPEGVRFENHGGVYLSSLTTLPEGVKFENHGYVYLSRLTTLPEGVRFENHGGVYLSRLTTLPGGVKFENHGPVDLSSLNGSHTYLGEERDFRNIDGYTMLMVSSRRYDGYTVHRARYFSGGEISGMRRCYVAEAGGMTAHGDSVKSAIEDLQFKIADAADKDEIAREVVRSGQVTLAQFRGITGACREGVRAHLLGFGIDLSQIDSMKLSEALAAMDGTSFGATFKQHVEKAQ